MGLKISSIANEKNITLIKKIVKANQENNYYSRLRYSLETDQLTKEIDLHNFSHI